MAGLISHTSAPMDGGWLGVDVWESEGAFREFGKILLSILQELGLHDVQPRTYPVFDVVTR